MQCNAVQLHFTPLPGMALKGGPLHISHQDWLVHSPPLTSSYDAECSLQNFGAIKLIVLVLGTSQLCTFSRVAACNRNCSLSCMVSDCCEGSKSRIPVCLGALLIITATWNCLMFSILAKEVPCMLEPDLVLELCWRPSLDDLDVVQGGLCEASPL